MRCDAGKMTNDFAKVRKEKVTACCPRFLFEKHAVFVGVRQGNMCDNDYDGKAGQ